MERFLSLAIAREPALRTSDGFKRLEKVHQEAVRWVTGVGLPRLWAVAASMVCLAPPLLRLEQLSLGLALHIDAAPSSNPSHALFARYRNDLDPALLQPTPPCNTPFLAQLAFLPIHLAFEQRRSEQAQLKIPLTSRATFVRQTTLHHYDRHSANLATYVRPSCRIRGAVDGALLAGNDDDLKRAVRWRIGTFGVRLRCLHCGQKFTRGCVAHMRYAAGLYNDEGRVDETEIRALLDEAAAWRRERAATGGKGCTFDAMDLLVGNRRAELAEIGLATLRVWESRMRAFSRMS